MRQIHVPHAAVTSLTIFSKPQSKIKQGFSVRGFELSVMARCLKVENLLPQQNVGWIINYLQKCYRSRTMWELPVAVDHIQLQTMASETISNWLVVTTHPAQGSTPWAPPIAWCKWESQTTRHAAATRTRTHYHQNARPKHCLCGHSMYKINEVQFISGSAQYEILCLW